MVGHAKRSVEDVTKKKARRSTDCIARVGRKSETRSQKKWANGSKGPKHQRNIGSGREESRHTLYVKVNERKSHLTVRRWESEQHKNWSMPAGGFRNLVATGGFLLGVSGKWSACGWSVVQLDHDQEVGPMHGMCGTLDAELDVERTINRAELTAFLC